MTVPPAILTSDPAYPAILNPELLGPAGGD